MVGRGLSFLPLPVRLAITLPVACFMIAINTMAYSNKMEFEAHQEMERSRSHHHHEVVHEQPAAFVPTPARHDPTAYYPSEHAQSDEGDGTGLKVLGVVAAAGVGASVLAGSFGLYVMVGGTAKDEEGLGAV
ncbi:MAG: hypothetical protein KC621_09540 [Myxococcales bacterium]|nr:hypothetical protein [Myxococcales bacterium]